MDSTNKNNQNTSKRRLGDENDKQTNEKRIKSVPKILDGKFFEITIRSSDNNVKARCTQCSTIRSGSIAGTGNFTRHYYEKHKERIEELYNHIKPKQNILSTAGKDQSTLTITDVTTEKVFFLLCLSLKLNLTL